MMQERKNGRPILEHWQVISVLLAIYDVLAVCFAYLFALWIRFDCEISAIPGQYFDGYWTFAPIYALFCLGVFWKLKLYKSIWRFASFMELTRIGMASAITTVFQIAGSIAVMLLVGDGAHYRMPISYYFVGALLQFILVLGIRFSYRFVLLLRNLQSREVDQSMDPVMLVGAGSAGQMILRDVNGGRSGAQRIVCIIDDNPNKWERYIDGVPA